MTVQEIGDEFTLLSHQGQAQAKVMHVSGGEVKNVTGIEMIGDDIALIKSETIRNQDAESAKIINEKLKIDVWKFVEKKNPDYKKDVIKHQTLVSLLIEFASKREEALKADFDYFIEGKDVEIMELKEDLRNKKIAIQNKKAEIKLLGDRCNQLLKDKGDLTDRLEELQEQNSEMFNTIALQEQQIEKMKCCIICDYGGNDFGVCYSDKPCKNKNQWKLAKWVKGR